MPTTRTFKSLGRIAEDAVEVTEDDLPLREQGVAYRRTNLTDVPQLAGELYDVPPSTENINQKLFNMSSFTDLIDKRGIPGWSNLVNYSPTFPEGPAIVWGTDGALDSGNFYFCLRPSGPSNGVGIVPVDPITEDQNNPGKFWLLFENPVQLRLDLESQVPGDEGARRVGYNKVEINGGLDEGLTVKQALDQGYLGLQGIKGFEILASAAVNVTVSTQTPPSVIFSAFVQDNVNVSAGNIAAIPELDSLGDPTILAQGFKITFDTPIPAPYGVQATPHIVLGVRARHLISYGNLQTDSLEIYFRFIEDSDKPLSMKPQLIGHSGPEQSDRSTTFAAFSFLCYTYNP